MSLTTTQRREYLDYLGWTQRYYAARIGWNESTVRRWMRDHEADVPPEIDAWLQRHGEALKADPPPIVAHKRGPNPGSATGQ
jgi:hypothetical protein